MTEPYKLTASEALALMKKGDLTVEAYVQSLLTRIADRDPIVQTWAYLNPSLVLAQARALDQLPPEKRGPLHGLPIGIKDVLFPLPFPSQPTNNPPIYRTHPPSLLDASPITTLRASGALIFGKTTTTLGGPSRNPHDPSRTPGGSSSGSGAAVGDYQIPLALGTQTGGSTIRPGAFNGVYAFKPTWGAISREGLAQYSVTCDTVGLYARSVGDLEVLARVFQIADDECVGQEPFELRGARVVFCKSPVWRKAGLGTRAAFARARELLEARGAEVADLELPEEFAKIETWHANVLAGEGRTSFLGNYLLARDQLDPLIQGHVENVEKVSRKAQLEAYDGCARLRPVWDELASRYDAVITPSVVDEAPVGVGHTGDASFCCMWTILQVPTLNVPGFAGENGLPIGLTVVGPRYRDLHVLHVGKALGEVFEKEGGWKHGLF